MHCCIIASLRSCLEAMDIIHYIFSYYNITSIGYYCFITYLWKLWVVDRSGGIEAIGTLILARAPSPANEIVHWDLSCSVLCSVYACACVKCLITPKKPSRSMHIKHACCVMSTCLLCGTFTIPARPARRTQRIEKNSRTIGRHLLQWRCLPDGE